MRRFIVETIVDALILVVIILVLGIVTIPQPFPFGPESGADRPAARRRARCRSWSRRRSSSSRSGIVRPVIVAFTGRLLLSTMGLFVVIVNALVIWVASIVAPDIAIVAQPAALWLLVFAALYTLLSTVMDALLGPQPAAGWS